MNLTIFVPLLIAHVLGDFCLQNDKQCRNKEEVPQPVFVRAFLGYRAFVVANGVFVRILVVCCCHSIFSLCDRFGKILYD